MTEPLNQRFKEACARSTTRLHGWCIPDMTDGWINPADLCPPCTRVFMQALDGIAGPLVWHSDYAERARHD